MKKIISIIAVLLIVAVFASGCGSDKGTTANNQRPNETVVSEIPTVEPKPTDVEDDPTGQSSANPVSRITSADLEPYFGEGYAAAYVCIDHDNKEIGNNGWTSVPCYPMVFYDNGTVGMNFSDIDYQYSITEGNIDVITLQVADYTPGGDWPFVGEYEIVNGNIVFSTVIARGERKGEPYSEITCVMEDSGDLLVTRHYPDYGKTVTNTYEYVGYLVSNNPYHEKGLLSYSDDFVLEDE